MAFADDARKAKGESPRKFNQDRAWRWLKAHPGSSSTELAAGLGLSPNSAAHLLKRMRDKGFARMTHRDHRKAPAFAIWYHEGTKPPTNNWGAAMGSLNALRPNWNRWEDNLILANQALGREYKRVAKSAKKVVDDCDLSRAWGMMPLSAVDNPTQDD